MLFGNGVFRQFYAQMCIHTTKYISKIPLQAAALSAIWLNFLSYQTMSSIRSTEHTHTLSHIRKNVLKAKPHFYQK